MFAFRDGLFFFRLADAATIACWHAATLLRRHTPCCFRYDVMPMPLFSLIFSPCCCRYYYATIADITLRYALLPRFIDADAAI